MSLRNETELANTRRKLARLEAHYERLRAKSGSPDALIKASRASLKRHINQFKEEIARYEAHQLARH